MFNWRVTWRGSPAYPSPAALEARVPGLQLQPSQTTHRMGNVSVDVRRSPVDIT